MKRQPLNLRLPESLMGRISTLALERRVSRQKLIEDLLESATTGIAAKDDVERDLLMPSDLIKLIQSKVEGLNANEEISLKKLVGKTEWDALDDSLKRNLGKNFKTMVGDGEFPSLRIGSKSPSNEQRYLKVEAP